MQGRAGCGAEVREGEMIGDIMRTPYESSGLVRIVAVEWVEFFGCDMAQVEYVEDHPHGYKKRMTGWYRAADLRPVQDTAGDAAGTR